ncbi:PQQ-binding-like beta-propeller repeat protein [Pelagicoccus sp. SDUM812003]|uniref:PQQ-binding-like beta-propeller repeat protein n=1 Tax=Pelagicoccus sp. SDUM812003 TaxID=3041267 RepID=UPI00280E262E|nr:PQQ-binding-like beta-propeller repeat protein [Pelagicoccus sp. SDUM812003]MDQ8204793.1 PQQ-binding-like beta-propeller repeat protein [Pelagicoccus sp. SDUM812003]
MLGSCLAGALPSVAADGDLLWEFQTNGSIFASPAVSSSGSVFIASRDNGLYALSPSGSEIWRFQAADWIDSTPTLSHDEATVYVGSWDNALYAVDASNGVELWRFETGNLVVGSPSLDAWGNVFIGSSDGFLYSIDKDGGLRWSYFVGAEMDSSPAIDSAGRIFVGGMDGSLYAFSNTGEALWEFEIDQTQDPVDHRIKSSPTIGDDGTVYFGGGDGGLYAVSPEGDFLWKFQAEEAIDTGVALLSDGSLVFASHDGFVYCVDTEGVKLWESYVGDVFYSTPAIDDSDRIFVGCYLGSGVSSVSALDPAGELVLEYLVSDYVDASPVLDGDGRLLFGCYDGSVYAIEWTGDPGLSSWHRFGADNANRSLAREGLLPTLSQGFGEWLLELGYDVAATDPFSDEDGDGTPLVLEYALGTNPSRYDRAIIDERIESSVDGDALVREFDWISGDQGLTLQWERSEDLRQWQPVEEGAGGAPKVSDLESEEAFLKRRVEIPLGDGADSVFWRFRVADD